MEAKRKGTIITIAVIVLALIAAVSLASIRLGTHVSARTYRMEVAFNGKAPWGDVGPEVEGERPPTVLYRRVGNSYCYTAFESEQLTEFLKQRGAKQATVQYNVFSTFGREGRYTLRSIDGVLLADGKKTVERVDEFGGQILLSGDETSSCP
jgi:hypothetical protein